MKKRIALVVIVALVLALFLLPTSRTGYTVADFSPSAIVNTNDCFVASTVEGSGVSSGDTIVLSAPIAAGSTTCADLDVSGVTFDCAGYAITNQNGAPQGLLVRADNILVKNCAINASINLVGLVNNSMNVTLMNGTYNGDVQVLNGSNVTLEDNAWGSQLISHDQQSLIVRGNTGIDMIMCDNCTESIFLNNTMGISGQIIVMGTNNTISANNWVETKILSGQSPGIYLDGLDNKILGNILFNGAMQTINVTGNYTLVANNRIENISGTAFRITGINNTLRNNTLFSFDGIGFDISNEFNVLETNNLTFVLKETNTSLNLANLSTPLLSEFDIGFFLRVGANRTILRNNTISVQNPLGLRVGVLGIETQANSTNLSGMIRHTQILNNTITAAKIALRLVDAENATVLHNTFIDNTYRGIHIEAGNNHAIDQNIIQTGDSSNAPSVSETGIELYRTRNHLLTNNALIGYHTGLFLLDGISTNASNLTIANATGQGVFSMQSRANTFENISIFNTVRIGFKFFFTNTSVINFSAVNGTQSGFEFYQSFVNAITFSNQTGATFGLALDLFSANNTVNNNTFSTNADVDFLFDMFATNNTGIGNTFLTTRTENGANTNVIT